MSAKDETKDKPYKIMEFTLIGSLWTETISARLGLTKNPGAIVESNPLMRCFMKNDFRAIVFTTAESVFWHWGLEKLRKHNKTLGYIVMGVAILVKGVCTYLNFRLSASQGRRV